MSEYGSGPEIRIKGKDETGPAFDSAKHNAEGLNATVRDLAGDMAGHAARMVAEVFTVSEAFKGLKDLIGETIKTADELRDLQASLQVLSSSVKEGVASWKFFEEEQKNTRATAIELASMYRDVLPVAMKRFGEEGTRQLTVMLAQIAPLMGKTAQEMDDAFKQLLMGRVRGTNPLLVALGMTKEEFKAAGGFSDEMIQKMVALAKQGEDLGQTFESTAHKIKAEWFDALGEGFNKQRAEADAALGAIKDGLTNPETIVGLHNLGSLFESTFTGMMAVLNNFDANFNTVLSKIGDLGGWADTPYDAYGKGKTNSTAQRNADIRMGASWTPDVKSVTGGGSLQQFQQQIGEMARSMDSGQFTAMMGSIRDEVHNGSIEWSKYRIEVAEAASGIQKLPHDAKTAIDQFDSVIKGFKQDYDEVSRALLLFGGGAYVGDDPFQQAMPSKNLNLGLMSLTPGEDPMVKWAREWSHEVELQLHDMVTNQFSTDLASIFESGGKNFGKIMGREFNSMIQQGADQITAQLFGKRGDPRIIDPATGKPQDQNQIYGGVFGPTGTKVANAAMTGATIGFGSYTNAQSADGGNHTASGAMAGAMAGSSFGPWGAVIGAVIGGIAGALGDAARRADYKYGVPMIDQSGQVTLGNTQNLTGDAAKNLTSQIQGTYDTYRNQYMRTLQTLGMDAPTLGGINGQFQQNPSAHWQDNLQQWLAGTLPKNIADQFKSTLKEGFGTQGLSGGAFDAIWSKWSNLDPSKMASMFDGLATIMTGVSKATGYFKGSVSANYSAALGDVNATFTDSLKTGDTDILKFATDIKSLVGEDQINAAKQLSTMLTDRMNKEKSFLQDIIKMTEQAHQQISDARNNLNLMGIRKADGTPDYEGQAKYLQNVANSDLARISGSKTVQDADQWLQRYINDINQIVGLGYNINAQTGEDWRKWALDQLGIGQSAFDRLSGNQQNDVKNANDAFLAQFDPAMQGIIDSISGVGSSITNIGDDFNRLHDPIDRVGGSFHALADATDALVARMNAAGGSSFAQSTRIARAS